MAIAYRELVEACCFVGDNERAEEYALKSLHMLEKFFPDINPEVLFTYRILVAFYHDLGREEDFKRCDEKTTEIFKKVQTNVWTNKLSYAQP